ncbi:hypothetical protein D3C84_819930 [compost metagenome]
MLGGEVHRQHRAHRQTADEHVLVFAPHTDEGIACALVPVTPTGGLQVGVVSAVPGQRRHVDRAARLGQADGDPTQLGRGAGEAVDQQHRDLSAAENETGAAFAHVDLLLVHRVIDRCSKRSSRAMPKSISG